MRDDISRLVAGRILSLKNAGEKDTELAARIGLTPQLIDYYKNKGAGLDAIERVLQHVPNLSPAWLLMGKLPQYARPLTEAEIPAEQAAEELSVRLRVIGKVVNGEIDPSVLRALATSPVANDEKGRKPGRSKAEQRRGGERRAKVRRQKPARDTRDTA